MYKTHSEKCKREPDLTQKHTGGKCENNKKLKHADDGTGERTACSQRTSNQRRPPPPYLFPRQPLEGANGTRLAPNLPAPTAQGWQRAAEFKRNNRATRKLTASYPPASPSTKQQALSSNLKRWIKGSEWKSALFLFLTVTSGQEHLAISPLYHPFFFFPSYFCLIPQSQLDINGLIKIISTLTKQHWILQVAAWINIQAKLT